MELVKQLGFEKVKTLSADQQHSTSELEIKTKKIFSSFYSMS